MLQRTVLLLLPSLLPQQRAGARSETNYMQISIFLCLVNSYNFFKPAMDVDSKEVNSAPACQVDGC